MLPNMLVPSANMLNLLANNFLPFFLRQHVDIQSKPSNMLFSLRPGKSPYIAVVKLG